MLLNDSRPGATWTETSRRIFPDVFDPAWEARVRAVAERECGPRRGSANLLGYFPDNELNWYGKWPAGRGCSRQHPESCLSNCLLTWFLLVLQAGCDARRVSWFRAATCRRSAFLCSEISSQPG